MPANIEELKLRLHNAQESLDTELKSWLDPRTEDGKCVIAKTCMALRNNNGGFLIVGICDDGKPDNANVPTNIRDLFHHDRIQEIVSKYSSDRFEITVHFVEHDGHDRVMIEVASGIRVPAVCKSALTPASPGCNLRADAIYVRTLNRNGIPSSAPAGYADWAQLLENCFTNREADIGAFLRRHLPGLQVPDNVSGLAEAILATKAPTPAEVAHDFMEVCYARYRILREQQQPTPPDTGTREASVVISGDFSPPDLTEDFLLRVDRLVPNYSGWRPWAGLMSKNLAAGEAHYFNDGQSEGWEAFVYETEMFHFFDFSRIESSGHFYYIEGLADDLRKGLEPGKHLEFVWETSRVTEIVATALAFAKALCGSPNRNQLVLEMRWKGLNGRHLSSWMHPERQFIAREPTTTDTVTTRVTMPVDTAPTAIGAHVEALVKPVFRLFGGWAFQSGVLQQIITERIVNHR